MSEVARWNAHWQARAQKAEADLREVRERLLTVGTERDAAVARAERAEAAADSLRRAFGMTCYSVPRDWTPSIVNAYGEVTPLPDGPFWWDGEQACRLACWSCGKPIEVQPDYLVTGEDCSHGGDPWAAVPLGDTDD